MISTRLLVEFRENGKPLGVSYLVVCFKVSELPSYEWVVVGVFLCCEERSSEVRVNAKSKQVLLALWWEKVQPMIRVLEVRNHLIGHSYLFQYLVLSWVNFRHFRVLLYFFLSGLYTHSFPLSNFSLQAICCCLNWHTGTVETKWPQNTFAKLFLVSRLELTLRHRVAMT